MQKEKEIPLFKVYMSDESVERTDAVLGSGFIGQGEVVEEFENMIKDIFQWDYVLTVNSATSAEHLAFHMLKTTRGLQNGDEVLATPLTCTASNWPILANGLKIKWVDVDPNTLNMDIDDLARKIGPETRAIMLVHWGGFPNDLDRVKQIVQNAESIYGNRIHVIEDCAHAMGSTYKGKRIGTHDNICTFSLQAIKHVTSGDGGILFLPSDSADLYKKGKLLRWYGIDRETNRKDFRCEADVAEWGFKFHMNDINAAIGIGNMKQMHHIVSAHKSNGKFYDRELQGISGVTVLRKNVPYEYDSSFWIYSLLVERKMDFQRAMKDRGIACSQVHERNDIHTTVKEYKSLLPSLDTITPRLSSIPVGWWVTEEDRERIVEAIKKGW